MHRDSRTSAVACLPPRAEGPGRAAPARQEIWRISWPHYLGPVPARKELLQIEGREVAVSNPEKIFFPQRGHTKLDLVRYYLAVADGALRGAGGRPMALKRFPNGAEGEFFFQ